MTRPPLNHPTELELEILKVLWRHGPATVREVREALAPTRKLAHTSVITMMNIMTDKGYLTRDTGESRHVYRARVTANSVRKRMLGDLVRRAFDGSAVAMMLHLLDTSDLNADELVELRRHLNEKEEQS